MKQQNTEIKNALATRPGGIAHMPCIGGKGTPPSPFIRLERAAHPGSASQCGLAVF